MSKILTPARVTAGATWLTGLGALVVSGVGVFPTHWQAGAIGVAGILTQAGAAVKFLDGQSKWETASLQHESDKIYAAGSRGMPIVGEPETLAEKALVAEPVVDPEVLAAEDSVPEPYLPTAPEIAPPVPSLEERVAILQERLDKAGIAA